MFLYVLFGYKTTYKTSYFAETSRYKTSIHVGPQMYKTATHTYIMEHLKGRSMNSQNCFAMSKLFVTQLFTINEYQFLVQDICMPLFCF